VKRFSAGLLAVVLALTAFPVVAQQKPDFSGDWKINQVKSNFGDVPAPDTFTRKIVHKEPSLTIDEAQASPIGVQETQRKYVTNGTESTFSSGGAEVKTSAKWEGTTLLVVSNVEVAGMVFNDRMSLSADGKTLTSVVRLDTPQGSVDMTVVFDKQ
jgi:hypothetical protein